MSLNKKKSISDFSNLTFDIPLEIRTPEQVLNDEDYKIVKEIFDTTAKYKSNNWHADVPFSEIQNDCIKLQSLLVTCAFRMGTLLGYAEGIDDQLKISRSKIRIKARDLKTDYQNNGDAVNVTIDDIKDLSYVNTEQIWVKLQQAKIAADFVKFVYFAAKDQVTMLDHALHRLSRLE